MNAIYRRAFALSLVAASLLFAYAIASPNNSKTSKSIDAYSSFGHGPDLILLHDSKAQSIHWAEAAKKLASRFHVILVDISKLPKQVVPEKTIHDELENMGITFACISGSQAGEQLALSYASSYPDSSKSFTLPQTGEDLELLTELFNSTCIL